MTNWVRGDISSGLLLTHGGKEKRASIMQNVGEGLGRGHATGAASLQFCRRAWENTALHYNNLNNHTAACEQQKQPYRNRGVLRIKA